MRHLGTILPSFYIDDACKRLKRIANSLDRYIQGKATINLDLTMFNYNDILNTFWGLQIEREYLELPYDIRIDYRGIDCSRTFRVPLVRIYL